MLQSSEALPLPVTPADLHVEELERLPAPDKDEFERDFLRRRRPAVFTGMTDGWAPPAQWTLDSMARKFGAARVVAAVLSQGTLFDDPATGVVFRHISLGEFIASLADAKTASHYVMAPTWNFPPSFQNDFRVPPYCVGAPHYRAKVWVGKAGTVTPVHYDIPHNLHVHLTGRKRWLLFPPGRGRMYPRGLLSGMPNFSEVNPENPDYDRHPRLREVTALGATLEAGETLFIPHGWWHHARSLDDIVSMNFWWGGQVVQLASLASTTFKRLRRIRRDEWG